LNQVYAVGDALRDMQAFASAGCKPILVRTGKGKETLAQGDLPPNVLVMDDLAAAAQYIITEQTTPTK
jgi:D-glycero-D-manno-heptose 1,7-bisphosphate phosphatase